MSLSDKEKVLQYILSEEISLDGNLLLNAESYREIDGISPDDFIKQLFALQDDKLLSIYFYGQSNVSTATKLSICSKARTYFEDKNKAKKDKILHMIALTSRDIIMLAIGAIFAGICTYVITIFTIA